MSRGFPATASTALLTLSRGVAEKSDETKHRALRKSNVVGILISWRYDIARTQQITVIRQ